MRDERNPLGFWIKIENEDDARYAIKMAGLPVALLGFNFVIAAILQAVNSQFLLVPLWLIFAALFFWFGFRIRGGGTQYLPVLFGAVIIAFALSIMTLPLHQIAVSALAIGLTISGVRGWLWLKRSA